MYQSRQLYVSQGNTMLVWVIDQGTGGVSEGSGENITRVYISAGIRMLFFYQSSLHLPIATRLTILL